MSYCSWCHLESESDDVCTWCKRPFAESPSIFKRPAKSDLHFLRVDDPDAVEVYGPLYAILGVIICVGVIIGGYFIFARHAPPQQVSNLPVQQETLYPTGQQSDSYNQPSSAPNIRGHNGPAPFPPSNPLHGTGGSPQPATTDNSFGGRIPPKVATMVYAHALAGLSSEAQNSSVYIESGKLLLLPAKSGSQRVGAEVVLVNDSQSDLSDWKLSVAIGGKEFPLEPYKGSLEQPFAEAYKTVPARGTLSGQFYSPSAVPDASTAGATRLVLSGTLDGKSIHSEMTKR